MGSYAFSGHTASGCTHHDMRFLSGYEIGLSGTAPVALAAAAPSGNQVLLELTNDVLGQKSSSAASGQTDSDPDVTDGDSSTVNRQQLAIHWTRTLDGDRVELADELAIANHGSDPVGLSIDLAFDADFRDIFAIRGLLAIRPGRLREPQWIEDRLCFGADGADGVVRTTRVEVDPKPDLRDGSSCRVDLSIEAGGERRISVRIRADEELESGAPPLPRAPEDRSRHARRIRDAQGLPVAGGPAWGVTIRSEALALDSVLARSMADLRTLIGKLDGQRYYAAGIPWFSALFGRDSLISAYQTLAFDPTIAAETLRLLAGRQGSRVDRWRDEEPGRILHELRVGELARLDEIPQTPSYGSIDRRRCSSSS